MAKKKFETPSDLGIVVKNKTEVFWQDLLTKIENDLKMYENQIMLNTAMIEMIKAKLETLKSQTP